MKYTDRGITHSIVGHEYEFEYSVQLLIQTGAEAPVFLCGGVLKPSDSDSELIAENWVSADVTTLRPPSQIKSCFMI